MQLRKGTVKHRDHVVQPQGTYITFHQDIVIKSGAEEYTLKENFGSELVKATLISER